MTMALLVTAPGCPHCPTLKQGLLTLQAEGVIHDLEVVDAVAEPARAEALGVRSVPWYRIGAFEFEGQMGLGELREWARLAAAPEGMAAYFLTMLKTGKRAKVEAMIRAEPRRAAALGQLVADPAASMAVRLGVGAVLEELEGTGLTVAMVPRLAAMLDETESRDRADIAHFLGLIGGDLARRALSRCLTDADPEVREIAEEALAKGV